MVKEKLISDIELRLSGGLVSKDLEIERSQIGHWLDITRDRLVAQELDKLFKKGEQPNPLYIEPEEAKVIQEENPSHLDDPRYYITLLKTPLYIDGDRGIVKVRTSDLEPVRKTTIGELDMIKNLAFAKPCKGNYMYWRAGVNLYLEGFTARMADEFTIDVYYISSYSENPPAETDDFKLSDDLMPLLLDLVEETARREFSTPQDLQNDGEQ